MKCQRCSNDASVHLTDIVNGKKRETHLCQDCAEKQDVVDSVYRRYRGRVNFLSLDVRDDRGTVRELVRQHGWEMPVGFDRDGAVASLYRIGGCPTLAYAYPGGTLQSASIGDIGTAAQLSNRVDRLLEATRAAEAG